MPFDQRIYMHRGEEDTTTDGGNEHTRMAKLALGEGASSSASALKIKNKNVEKRKEDTETERTQRRIQKTRRDWKKKIKLSG